MKSDREEDFQLTLEKESRRRIEGRFRETAGVSVSVSDSRRALRRAKKEENESERSARKEIRALVDSGPAAASFRLGAGP